MRAFALGARPTRAAPAPHRAPLPARAGPGDDAPSSSFAGTTGGGGPGGGLDPALEVAVPPDQRPVNELAALRVAPLYSWATLPAPALAARLAAVFAATVAALGAPIAAQSYNPAVNPAECAAAASLGGLIIVGGVTLRLYLGWNYVATRLLSAAIPYEETGWYDGQTFVKPPAVLARDRLLGTYEARPALARLRVTLAAVAAATVATAGALALSPVAPDGGRAPPRLAGGVPVYSRAVASPADLALDDDAAEAEAAAQMGRPGYCGDELLRAAAGASAAVCMRR